MIDMAAGSTRVAFQLASVGNRRGTANGGYDVDAFDKMVRSPSYAPLLMSGDYEVISQRQSGSRYSLRRLQCS